jgi:hypothetical protein
MAFGALSATVSSAAGRSQTSSITILSTGTIKFTVAAEQLRFLTPSDLRHSRFAVTRADAGAPDSLTRSLETVKFGPGVHTPSERRYREGQNRKGYSHITLHPNILVNELSDILVNELSDIVAKGVVCAFL